MSYLVFALKYRPQVFADMVGQEHVVQTLQGAIQRDRVAHAFLFTGARGVGKTTSARILAKALNCAEGPTLTPCGRCEACVEIAASRATDVQEIDGASNNGVDQVRELRDGARYLPSRDRFKIFIIDEVHMLTTSAFNALLKTLEEPPPHVKFIFATTEPHKIPLTILSRTQRFDFRRIPLAKIAGRIETICEAEGITMDSGTLGLVARQAGGSMRDALSLLDQVVGAAGETVTEQAAREILGAIDRNEVLRLGEALLSRDAAGLLEAIARVHDRGLDLGKLIEELARHLRNLIVARAGADPRLLLDVTQDEQAELAHQAQTVSPATLTAYFDLLMESVPRVRRSAQPRLVLEVALLSAIQLAPSEELSSLIGALRGGPLPGEGEPPSQPARPAAHLRSSSISEGSSASRSSTESSADPVKSKRPTPVAAQSRPAPTPPAAPDPEPDLAAEPSKQPEQAAQQPGPQSEEPPPPESPFAPTAASAASTASAASSASDQGAGSADAPAPKVPAGPQAKSRSGGKAPSAANPPPKLGTPRTSNTRNEPRQAGAREGAKAARLPAGDDPSLDLAGRYEAFAAAVMKFGKKPYLASALEHGRPLELSQDTLSLAMPRGLYLDGLGNPGNRGRAEAFLADHFGRPIELRLEVEDSVKLEGVPEAIAMRRERELLEHTEEVRAAALACPAVKLAVETLGGKIEEIRVREQQEDTA